MKLLLKLKQKSEYLGLTSTKYKYFFNTNEHVSLRKISYRLRMQLTSSICVLATLCCIVNVCGLNVFISPVFVLVFKERYRIQSDQLEDLWLITKELRHRLEEHFKKQNCKDFTCTFSGSIPLQEYFELIDRHFEVYESLLFCWFKNCSYVSTMAD